MIGSLLLLVVVFGFIFFVARGCVATQQSTQVRKYVTSADSLLSDSSNAGRGELQNILGNAGGDASKLDDGALSQVANRSDQQYQQALQQEEKAKLQATVSWMKRAAIVALFLLMLIAAGAMMVVRYAPQLFRK